MTVQNITLPQIQTEVLLELVEVGTGKVLHTQTERNSLSSETYANLMIGYNVMSSPRIWISDRRVGKNPGLANTSGSPFHYPILEVASQTPTVYAQILPKTLSTPYIVEYKCQFNPTAADRTIWTVGASNSGTASNIRPHSIVALSTSCVQTGTVPGPGAVLVVTYRIQILAAVAQANTFPSAKSFDRMLAERFANETYAADGATSLYYAANTTGTSQSCSPAWTDIIPSGIGIFMPCNRGFTMNPNGTSAGVSNGWEATGSTTIATTYTPRFRYGCTSYSQSFTNTQGIGWVIGSFYHGNQGQNGTTLPLAGTGIGIMHTGVAAVKPTWQPVQTIFSHSVSGTEPFQQVAALATGTGIVNADGASWTYPLWPEYYRISVTGSGNVGTARYSFSQRSLTGFTTNIAGTGSSWNTATIPVGGIMPVKSNNTAQLGGVYADDATVTKSHHTKTIHPWTYAQCLYNLETLPNGKVLVWDATGVTQYDLKLNTYRIWNSVSTPALPVTNVRQCAYESSGIIWVACTNTGLWKISADGNTVTNYTTFDSITTSNVYGVDVGISNTVVVLVNGGLVTSVNSGSTWVVRTFTYTGISDSNWLNVYWVRVQKNSPTLRLALARSINSGSTGNLVWWSTAAGAAIVGPTFGSSIGTPGATSSLRLEYSRCLTVSDTGDSWFFLAGDFRGHTSWGTTLFRSTMSGNGQSDDLNHGAHPLYDYYGTPYYQIEHSVGGEVGGFRLVDNDGYQHGLLTSYAAQGMRQNVFSNVGNGVYLGRPASASLAAAAGFTLTQATPNMYAMVGSNDTRGPRNLEHTMYEEFVWNNYQWNGSAWVNGYHAPALDTAGAAGGPFNGVRHRFNVESHAFTGRSCVVVPTAPLTSFFTTALTFAVRSTSLAALAGQPARQQLMSWVNTSTGMRVQFYLNDGFGYSSLVVVQPTSTYFRNYSSTSITMGTGSKTFTVAAGLGYTTGMRLRFIAVYPGATATIQYMEGTVTSYTSTTLIMNIEVTTGSTANFSAWNIVFAGVRFGTMPTTGSAHNIALVLSGTSAQMFSDGTQVGSTLTIPSVDFSAATAELVIGGNRVNSIDSVGFDRATDFYRGTMINALLDSTAWNAGNISAHHAAGTSYTTATTRVQYLLTDSLAGLETKATHAGSETLLNGITNRFTNGAGTSFVTGEYYTFGVVKGILKDNATSFTHTTHGFSMPVEHGFSTLDSATVPATPTVVTEKVCHRSTVENNTNVYIQPGHFPTMWNSATHSIQTTSGDFTYSVTIVNDRIASDTDSYYAYVGVNDSKTVFPSSIAKWAWQIRAGASKLLDVYYNGSIVGTGVGTWVVGDVLTIQRTSGVLVFKQNAATLFTTSGGQNYAGAIWFNAYAPWSNVMMTGNHTITYSRPAHIMAIGDSGTSVGKYDPTFHNIMAMSATDLTVSIAGYGSPATVTIAAITDTVDTIIAAPPALNNVVLFPETGYLIFNAGDAGKAVTLNCSVIKFNY